MPKLSLALLGPFQATLDDEPLSGLTSGKARALLVHLAVESDRVHSREALAGLLWPDFPQESASSSLRNTLALLRKALGDHQAHTPFLLVARDALRFNRASDHSIDVNDFRSLLSGGDGSDEVTSLERATALYRGEFLAGSSTSGSPAFDDWVAFLREDLSRQELATLERLAVMKESRGEYSGAEASVRRLVALSPWREESHREMMRLLALSGRRSAALAQFEVCKRILKAELDVEPSRETVMLHDRIRDGSLSSRAQVMSLGPLRTGTAHQPSPSAQDSALSTKDSAPFTRSVVGRERELAWLDRKLKATLGEQGGVAFLVGEAGSGKTALLSEFVRRAVRDQGDLVAVFGSCNAQTGQGDPYLPFREVLQTLAGDLEAKREGGAISPERVRRLWALLPDTIQALVESGPDLIDLLVPGQSLLARIPALGPAAVNQASIARLEKLIQRKAPRPGSALQQSDLFEQVTRVLKTLASGRTLILVLDDLQWADRGSINLLFHLGRRLSGSHILLIGAYRPDEVASGRGGDRHPLEPVINELQRDLGEVLIDLDQAEGRRFVDEILDSEPNKLTVAFREGLYRRTSGHPLFTVELLRGLHEQGNLASDEDGHWVERPGLEWRRLPSRVEAVIAESVGRLPKELQGLLEAASVEGEEFTAEVVARVQSAEERTVIRQLSRSLGREHRLVAARSVRHVNEKRLSSYGFRHQLFQQYLYDRLDEVDRSDLHEAVGLALEEFHGLYSEEIAVRLAWHFEQAGLVGKALGYLLQAGNRALRVSAYVEAAAHFERGLSLLARQPQSPERDRQELDLQIALQRPLGMLHGSGSPELARALHRIRELCESLGDEICLRTAIGLLAFFAITQGRNGEAIVLSEQLLSLAEDTDKPTWLAVTNRLLSAARMYRGELVLGHEHIERAMALHDPRCERSIGRPLGTSLPISCLQGDQRALWMLGYPDRSRRRGEDALALARDVGEPVDQGLALTSAGMASLLSRDYETARELIEAADRWVAQKDDVHLPARMAIAKGRIQIREGLTEPGLTLMRRGIDWWRAGGTMMGADSHLQQLAEGCLDAEQVELGLGAVREAKALMEQGDARALEAEFHRLEGEFLLMRGEVGHLVAAEACFLDAIEVSRRQQARSWELRAATSLARLWQRLGKTRDAKELLAPIYDWFTEGFDTPDLVDARRLLAEL